jgi:hypothetical protein
MAKLKVKSVKETLDKKEYILLKLKEQVEKYNRDIYNISETNEEYYNKKDIYNEDKIRKNIHHSVNQLIGFINYPRECLIDININEVNKIIMNLINMKIAMNNKKNEDNI